MATTTLELATLRCGCRTLTEAHGGNRVMARCPEAEALKAETKRAGDKANDPKVRGGAKVALVREFARKRTAYREHVGLGR